MSILARLRRRSALQRVRADQPSIARLREALLSQMEVFSGLSPDAMHAVAEQLPMATARKNQVIYAPGETDEALFFLKSGKVRVYRIAPDGRKLLVAHFGPGTVFGEMALAGQTMTGSFAEAAEDSTVCIMSAKDVEQLMLEHPAVALALVKLLARRLRESERRIEQLAYHTIPSRLAATLIDLGHPKETLAGYSHQELAELLGTTRETVTRALDDFKSKGLVSVERKRIDLLDVPGLRLIAGTGEVERGTPVAEAPPVERPAL